MNKQTKNMILGAAVLSLTVTGGVAALTNAAPGNNGSQSQISNRRFFHPGKEMRENFDAIKEAIANNDYEAWKTAMSDHPKAEEFVNEETFAKMVEAYQLREAGDLEGAREIMEQLGLPHPGMRHHGPHGEHGQAVHDAIEAGDYQAWADAMQNHPDAAELVNEETFNKLMEAHQLMEDGDKDGAKEIFESLGLEHGHRDEHPPHLEDVDDQEDEL